MARSYDASRRRAQAQRTRTRILDAAVELHRRGVTAYEPLAELAGVSLATVRKYFPNKELLFQGCTGHFFESFEPPALEAAAAIADPGRRLRRIAAEMCRTHEATHELVWISHVEAAGSATLAAAVDDFAALARAAADALLDGGGLVLGAGPRPVVRQRLIAILDPLSYRAFRVQAGFTADATRRELTAMLGVAVGIPLPDCP